MNLSGFAAGAARLLGRSMIVLGAFCAGVAAVAFAAGAYVRATYHCIPGPLEPCDAGGLLGLSLVVIFGPLAGLVAAGFTTAWLVRRARRTVTIAASNDNG